MRSVALKGFVLLALCACAFLTHVVASDHDDGEVDLKGRALNLTDVYAFREDWQTGNAADAGNLILVMNSNPRSLARQQYYFSTQARYEFHVSTANATTDAPTTQDDLILRLEFGPPDSNNRQAVTLSAVRPNGTQSATQTLSGGSILTTSLADSDANNLNSNSVGLEGQTVTLFAGLREDPFFFDVEQYFRVRSAALNGTSQPGFRPANTALDFAAGYNVNAIVLRVPLALLQNGAAVDVFDVWATVSVPK